jgi:hypothetical protein
MGKTFFRRLTHDECECDTFGMVEYGEERVRATAMFLLDAKKEQREKEHQCKPCFYFRRGGIAGQAMWSWNCRVCGEEQMHHNTATPQVCKACCEQWELCEKCACDTSGRYKRKQKWPELSEERADEIRSKP